MYIALDDGTIEGTVTRVPLTGLPT